MTKRELKRQLIARARELTPEIKALAGETERSRKPLDSIISKLDDAGLLTFMVPERWGGAELDLQTQFKVVEIISSACMSTGWITAFYIGHHAFVCRFSEQAQSEVFSAGPRCLLPATTASVMKAAAVPGGWRLSGRATWGSGIMHADWVLVGGDAYDGRRVFLIPAAEVGFDDVWHMAAMAGTGSNDIVVDDVFVPQHRAELMSEFMEGTTSGAQAYANPIYRMPMLPFIFSEVIGIFTGGLNAAYGDFQDIQRKRVITHSGHATRERPNNHIQLGGAAASALAGGDLARALVSKTQNLLDNAGFTMKDRLELKALTGFTVDHCRRSINEMINRSGSSSFRSDAALQRVFRDINMVAIHAFWDWEVAYEQLGRHLVGLEPNNPLV